MRKRLRGLSERDWRTLDRVFVAGLVVIETIDLATTSELEGPLVLNLVVMTGIALSFLWRRSQPIVTALVTLVGLVVMAVFLTQPPNLVSAVLMLIATGYAVGRHMGGRPSAIFVTFGAAVIVTLSILYDPNDILFPVTFFWIVPWLAGRTIRNQTRLARELSEKAERAQHAREEDERRAIALERSRIARELHDVLAHNLSVMVVQAAGARQVLEKNPERAVEAASLIERTGREALAEIRQLFGPVRRGGGAEPLSGAQSIARVDDLARRAREAGLRVELRVTGDAVELPAGIDLAAYRIVQEALTNTLKHSPGARARVTVAYEPNEIVLSVEDDGEGPRDDYELGGAGGGHGLVGMRERAAVYGGVVQAGRGPDGGFAVRARLPTRPLVPGGELSPTTTQEVPA
ncbi:MAG: histidine kinase [Thermoleophilaceae bacterium]